MSIRRYIWETIYNPYDAVNKVQPVKKVYSTVYYKKDSDISTGKPKNTSKEDFTSPLKLKKN
jgi:hypothetical protein